MAAGQRATDGETRNALLARTQSGQELQTSGRNEHARWRRGRLALMPKRATSPVSFSTMVEGTVGMEKPASSPTRLLLAEKAEKEKGTKVKGLDQRSRLQPWWQAVWTIVSRRWRRRSRSARRKSR